MQYNMFNTYTDTQRGEHTMTPKVRVTVELPVKDAEALEKIQRKHSWTRAEFIRAAMIAIQAQDAQIESTNKKPKEK
jgi:metal-responsive CopG/Arc/MetJ family transcriptional regulator